MVSLTKFSIEVGFFKAKLSHARWEPLSIPLMALVEKYSGHYIWKVPCTPFGSAYNLATLEMSPTYRGVFLDVQLEVLKEQKIVQAKTFWFTDFAERCIVILENGEAVRINCNAEGDKYGAMTELYRTSNRVKRIILPGLDLTILSHEPFLHFKLFRRQDKGALEMFLRWAWQVLPKGKYVTQLLIKENT